MNNTFSLPKDFLLLQEYLSQHEHGQPKMKNQKEKLTVLKIQEISRELYWYVQVDTAQRHSKQNYFMSNFHREEMPKTYQLAASASKPTPIKQFSSKVIIQIILSEFHLNILYLLACERPNTELSQWQGPHSQKSQGIFKMNSINNKTVQCIIIIITIKNRVCTCSFSSISSFLRIFIA